jgi:SulP family sulfate permease
MQITFAAACASIIFGPVGLPLTIGIQHALFGFVVMQTITTYLTRVPGGVVLTTPSFEVLPFLAKFAVIVSGALGGAAATPGAVLATVLAGSILANLLGAVFLALVSQAPVENVDKLLPPPLQAGLFAAIGWSLYALSYDTLGLRFPSKSLFAWEAARLWLPANVLGVGLWTASRKSDSPLLFPIFIVAVTALVHGFRIFTGTPIDAARAGGWLMAEAVGEPCTALWRAISLPLVQWDAIFSAPALKQLLCAALFGPLINTFLNMALYGSLLKKKIDLKPEFQTAAVGTAASALSGGYSNYMGLSDTAIHRKIGGLDRLSCYIAGAVGGLFLLVHPLCAGVGYLPTLAIAGALVFVSCDFMYDNLVVASRESGSKGATLAVLGVFAVCLMTDMLTGFFLGIVVNQLVRLWGRSQLKQEPI